MNYGSKIDIGIFVLDLLNLVLFSTNSAVFNQIRYFQIKKII